MKVAIVEDHPSTSAGVKLYMEKFEFVDVCEFNSSIELLKEYDLDTYELFIVDIDMPEVNGLELTAKLKEKKVPGKIVIYTALNKTNIKKEAYEKGADCFINKKNDMKTFISEIFDTISDKKSFKQEFLEELRQPKIIKITNYQQKIIECIHRGLSRKEIANELDISVKTVDYHIINLKKIFHANSVNELKKNVFKSYL